MESLESPASNQANVIVRMQARNVKQLKLQGMSDKDYERNVNAIMAAAMEDNGKFVDLVATVAAIAGKDRTKLEQLKIWNDTIDRLTTGEVTTSGNLKKHIDNIKADKSLDSCLVFLSDGNNSLIFKRGDSEFISCYIPEVFQNDNSGELFGIFESIVEDVVCQDVDKFARIYATLKSIKEDYETEGVKIPILKPYSDFDSSEFDLLVTASSCTDD